ncbi:MAG: hypothetical protein IJW59_04380 [Clostridia bacterium]|nr:hypothetical protein [Clostridia bacterium]
MNWLLSVVGIVFLGILFDMIFPNGKINSLCRSLFGLFAMFVLISPILHIDMNIFEGSDFVDGKLIDSINSARDESFIIKINEHLKSKGFDGVVVEIDSKIDNDEYQIENIYVDITNLVLLQNNQNINTYEVIAVEINKLTNVDLERIVVYG